MDAGLGTSRNCIAARINLDMVVDTGFLIITCIIVFNYLYFVTIIYTPMYTVNSVENCDCPGHTPGVAALVKGVQYTEPCWA